MVEEIATISLMLLSLENNRMRIWPTESGKKIEDDTQDGQVAASLKASENVLFS